MALLSPVFPLTEAAVRVTHLFNRSSLMRCEHGLGRWCKSSERIQHTKGDRGSGRRKGSKRECEKDQNVTVLENERLLRV
jgi:hypothetical protein